MQQQPPPQKPMHLPPPPEQRAYWQQFQQPRPPYPYPYPPPYYLPGPFVPPPAPRPVRQNIKVAALCCWGVGALLAFAGGLTFDAIAGLLLIACFILIFFI